MKNTLPHKGFTLIELLVVIAIIAILSGTILVALNSARSKAKVARMQSEMQQLRAQMELYFTTYGNYGGPGGSAAVAPTASNCTASTPFNDTLKKESPYKLITALSSTIGSASNIYCGARSDRWVVVAQVVGTSAWWCVDSSGSSKSSGAPGSLTIANGCN